MAVILTIVQKEVGLNPRTEFDLGLMLLLLN
jgi:hypothetical protein